MTPSVAAPGDTNPSDATACLGPMRPLVSTRGCVVLTDRSRGSQNMTHANYWPLCLWRLRVAERMVSSATWSHIEVINRGRSRGKFESFTRLNPLKLMLYNWTMTIRFIPATPTLSVWQFTDVWVIIYLLVQISGVRIGKKTGKLHEASRKVFGFTESLYCI